MAIVRKVAFVVLYSSLGVCFFAFFMEMNFMKGANNINTLKQFATETDTLVIANDISRTIHASNLSIQNVNINRTKTALNSTKLLLGERDSGRDGHALTGGRPEGGSRRGNALFNASTVATATISLSPALEPKNWKRDGYFSVRDKEVMRHCNQCAIVTSSGHLLGTKAGPEIDATECVIRMNAAPTIKYAADVGHRTTFRIIGHRNFPRMFDTEPERQLYFVNPDTKSEAIVTAWLYAVNVGKNIETFLSRRYARKYKDIQFFLTTEDQMLRNERLFYQMLGVKKPKKHLWMSTGWTTMMFALEVCDDIHVYGMTYEEYCREHPNDKTYYHYFDKLRRACDYFSVSENKITTGHKFLTEKLSFANWASFYNITFHYPSWENHTSKAEWISPFHQSYLKYQDGTKQVNSPKAEVAKTDPKKTPTSNNSSKAEVGEADPKVPGSNNATVKRSPS